MMKSLLVACLCASFAQSLNIKHPVKGQQAQPDAPKYAKLGAEKDMEFVWQRPAGQVKGILFMAHGCDHHGTDFFESDSLANEQCKKSLKGRCLGLPEEVHMRRTALARNYLVVAATGGSKSTRGMCWHPHDLAKVKHGLDHIRTEEKLADVPLFATGASSGGKFVGYLAKADVHKLTCISPQISQIPASDFPKDVAAFFVNSLRKKVLDCRKKLQPQSRTHSNYVASSIELDFWRRIQGRPGINGHVP
jgi:hypothetical protein